jgi:SAM-dependent methyltransferase
MTQKKIFLDSEGDAWFRRNARALAAVRLPEADPLLMAILELLPASPQGTRILEIGCGNGARLRWLREHRGLTCSGLDPSADAVAAARQSGIDAHRGTADRLPFADAAFDIVVFGFCLYLCDRDDLFRIAAEADRVLADPAWLVILDFFSPTPVRREYRHRPGVFSHKMDYRSLFTWHPGYTCMSHRVHHHSEHGYTDDRGEWVATSVLRKHVRLGE